jgi:hypothetical protein
LIFFFHFFTFLLFIGFRLNKFYRKVRKKDKSKEEKVQTKKERKFCSSKCASDKKHLDSYKTYLENQDQYCRGNYTPKHFKEFFLKEQNGVCAICNTPPIHNNKELVFILDHIDGDASNNHRDNLRLICPNCDSQLETYKSKNKNSTRRNYWKEHLLKNINQQDEA